MFRFTMLILGLVEFICAAIELHSGGGWIILGILFAAFGGWAIGLAIAGD